MEGTAGILSGFKPSASSPDAPVHAATTQPQDATPSTPSDPDSEIVTAPVTSSTDAPAKPAAHPVALKTSAEAPAATPAALSAMPTATSSGTTMVQIAAVSHQEDADTLIAALKKKGYSVFIRKESQDRLLHVQVGPFATRKDADLMRQHLLADGYNAIVK